METRGDDGGVVALGTAGTGFAAGASAEVAAPAAVAAATAGCGKTPALASGTRTIQSGGKTRTYIVDVPANCDRNHPYRLVFGFHWNGGTATDVATGQTVQRDVWSYFGLKRLANNTAIFVAPQGINNGWANSGGEDTTFVDNMIKEIEAGLCVGTTQLFSIGFSYGAAMTNTLACTRATVFRAVAVQSGGSACNSNQPIAYLGVAGISGPPATGGRAGRDAFARLNGCTAQTVPEPSAGSKTHIVTAFSGCSAGHPVVWAGFDGGHIAAPQDGASGDSGARTWVPALAWNFFIQFCDTPPTTPPNASPTPTTSPTTPPTGDTCRVNATVSAWNTGLTETLTLTTTGSTAVNGWSPAFTLPTGQVVTSGWNATYSPASGRVRPSTRPSTPSWSQAHR
jgi:poly(3-hydroxybutyrate) depolymerase